MNIHDGISISVYDGNLLVRATDNYSKPLGIIYPLPRDQWNHVSITVEYSSATGQTEYGVCANELSSCSYFYYNQPLFPSRINNYLQIGDAANFPGQYLLKGFIREIEFIIGQKSVAYFDPNASLDPYGLPLWPCGPDDWLDNGTCVS